MNKISGTNYSMDDWVICDTPDIVAYWDEHAEEIMEQAAARAGEMGRSLYDLCAPKSPVTKRGLMRSITAFAKGR